MKNKLIPSVLLCWLSLQGINAANVFESVEGEWSILGKETVKFKGQKQSTYFSDLFSFYHDGSFTTSELGSGVCTQTGSKVTMSVADQELLDVINGYFDSLGYGGIIYADSVQSLKFSGKLKKGVLSGTFKWGFTVSAPAYGVYNLKASILGKYSGTRISGSASSRDSSEVAGRPLYGLTKEIVVSITARE
ncbi:MAG: hypothetical protein HY298_15375 [Verrucomicrobia bacterium]|nr:hypothetical protein [Verrucomicrobiota bacterium]